MFSIRAAVRYGLSVAAVVGMVAFSASPASAQEPADPNPGNVTLTGGIDFLNQYMFRGIRQNSTGMATWPFGDVGLAVYSGDGGVKSATVNFGIWNSLHSGDTGSDGPSGKLWYESDFYAALGLGFGGGMALTSTYTAYTSPNSMFTTVKEFAFKVAHDDSSYLGAAALPVVATGQKGDMVPLPHKLPKPVFAGTPSNAPPGTNVEKPLGRPRPVPLVPKGTVNLALKKKVTSA